MPKNIIKKFTPSPEFLQNHQHLKMFGELLHKPNLWAVNRKSVPGAFAIGLFVAWLPIPFQMVLAAALAIMFSVNIPVSVALVWITNPFTMPVMFYCAFLTGSKILGVDVQDVKLQISWEWLQQSFTTIGPSFLLGCIVLGIAFAIAGYIAIKSLWQYSIAFKIKKRDSNQYKK